MPCDAEFRVWRLGGRDEVGPASGSTSHATGPAPCRRRSARACCATRQQPSRVVLVELEALQGDPQQTVHFFLELDDQLGLGQLLLEPLLLALELLFARARLRLCGRAALLLGHALHAVLAQL